MFNEKKERPSWLQYVGYAFLIVWVGVFSYRYIDPVSRKDRTVLSNISRHEILSITIEPARAGYPTAINSPIVIDDKATISALSKALSRMSLRNPEHPKVTRAVILRLQMKDRVIGGSLEESSNDGASFYCMSDVTTGWIYGIYAVPGGRDIFDAITKLSSVPPTASRSVGQRH